jgi:hypothetical protein
MGAYTILNTEIIPDERKIKVTLMDRTYNVLSRIWAGDLTDTVDAIVRNIAQVIVEDGTTATYTTNIASTNSSGAAFPSINYFSTYKSAYEIIQELSQPEYTGDDRTYLFWVDENNVVNWQYPGQTVESTELNHGSDPVKTMKVNKTEADTISMVIYNAGADKNDTDYVNFYLDPEAGSIKNNMKYVSMVDISKDLKKTLTDNGTYASTSNEDYQATLQTNAVIRCRRIVQNIGQGLWQANVGVPGEKYTYGNLYNVSSTSFGFPKTELRINRIVHRMDKNGWQTDLELLQDADAITL